MADKGTIDDLRFDEHNFNRHTKAGMELLEKSIKENKFGRSILVDKDGNIIAGNATAETAKKLGKDKIKVVETNGDIPVCCHRPDEIIGNIDDSDIAEKFSSYRVTDMGKCERPCRLTGANWYLQDYKQNAENYFI